MEMRFWLAALHMVVGALTCYLFHQMQNMEHQIDELRTQLAVALARVNVLEEELLRLHVTKDDLAQVRREARVELKNLYRPC